MKKRLLVLILSGGLMWVAPMAVSAAPAYMAGVMEMSVEDEAEITYNNGTLMITGAEGCTLEVVSLTGKRS